MANTREIIKKKMPGIVLTVFRKLKNKLSRGEKMKLKERANEIFKKGEEVRRLEGFPRFTETEISFHNKSIKIVDIASFNFIRKEIFDQQLYKFEADTPTPYIIDCGSNIGLSIIYFKQLYPNAEIVGFEPDGKIFNALEHNIKAFDFSNVQLIQKACWDEEATLKFYSEGADGGRVAMKFDTEQIVEVETIRLRKFLDRKVDFLKIDIEGAEFKVLADCEDLLQNVENLFVEYHSYIGVEQSLDEILKMLKKTGFRYSIQQHGIVSKNPFITIQNQDKMDILLNISAYRGYQTI